MIFSPQPTKPLTFASSQSRTVNLCNRSNLCIEFSDRTTHAATYRQDLAILTSGTKIEIQYLALKILGDHPFDCFPQRFLFSPHWHQVDAGE